MELLIIGIVVSLIVQVIKKYLGTNTIGTLASVLILSVLGAIGYSFLQKAGLWGSVLPILTMAGAFYTFIIARFEE